jgi:hypothetical protein
VVAPGGGWVVMDALDMRGALGGAMGFTLAYARNPLRVSSGDGSQSLTVVSSQAFADFGFAVTYDRFRLSLALDAPLYAGGTSGTLGGREFTAPSVDPGSHPDTLTDARVGFDARLLGEATSAFRLGAGAQLFVPNGNRSDYVTDGYYRAMGRVLFAGDLGEFAYAGHLGVHVRPLDDAPTPGSPRGSEVIFGLGAGARLPVSLDGAAVIVGPELHGATALASFLTPTGTALEALLGARIEGTGDDGPQLRFKVATGAGLERHLGAPDWRLVIGIEIFNHRLKAAAPAPSPAPVPVEAPAPSPVEAPVEAPAAP